MSKIIYLATYYFNEVSNMALTCFLLYISLQVHFILTHCGRVTQICVFNTVNLGTSASSP